MNCASHLEHIVQKLECMVGRTWWEKYIENFGWETCYNVGTQKSDKEMVS